MDFVKLQAFAPSAQRTRQSQWRQYYKFCETFQLDPFPVSPSNVCRFLVNASESVSYVTLNNYVSALNALSNTAPNRPLFERQDRCSLFSVLCYFRYFVRE